jgi:hypothetical protein
MDKDQNINLKIENKEVAQFTGMARTQMFFETIMSFLRLILAIIVVGGIVLAIGVVGYGMYVDNQQSQNKSAKTPAVKSAPAAKPVKEQSQTQIEKPAIDLTPWRALRKDMTMPEVRSILGEPSRVDGGSFTTWHYPNYGTVTFYKDVVYLWREPS